MFTFGRILKLICTTALFGSLFTTGNAAISENDNAPQVSIAYFYLGACEACHEEGKLWQQYYDEIGDLDDDVSVDIKLYNVFHEGEKATMESYLEQYNVPDDRRLIPILFINGTYLAGADEIAAGMQSEFIKAVQQGGGEGAMELPVPDETEVIESAGNYSVIKDDSGDSVIMYFHVSPCEGCDKAARVLEALDSSYTFSKDGSEHTTAVVLREYNAGEAESMQLLKYYFDYYEVPEEDQKVPIAFVGNEWLSGSESIGNHLAAILSAGDGVGTAILAGESDGEGTRTNPLANYGILGIIATGLVNGLNPCSLSIVLFFLSLLAVKNVNLLKAGLCFILGKFVMFFLLGTLLYQLFLSVDISWLQTVTKVVIVALAIVFVILNVQDMLSAKKENYGKIRLQLPKSFRKFNNRIVKAIAGINNEKVFLPLSFVIGMVISAGEFLCTGQIYLATIVLVLQNSPVFDARAVLYFLVYGIAFIIPLLLLTVVIYKGKEIFEVSEAIRLKMPIIKMINALIFLIFAIVEIVLF